MSEDIKGNGIKGNMVAVVTMWGIFAMISFVTNMAAPFGTIWQGHYEWGGMMGNAMNFLAYLIMGIPAGRMLAKRGYKRTALAALATGFAGMAVQWLSCKVGHSVSIGGVIGLDYIIYLTGAFVCGFCVCMLNTVVNPLLNSLGGGGNRGNQLIQTGGTLNSLTGALTPLLVGVLVGTISSQTSMLDVQPLMFIAMGVFLIAFGILSAVTIPEPERHGSNVRYEHSALCFRHTVLGIVAIFFYVGLEVGIPGEMLLYFSDISSEGAGVANGVAVGGAVAAVYWLLMMVGRAVSSAISGKVSTRTQLVFVACLAAVLVICAILFPKNITMRMPAYSVAGGFAMVPDVPVQVLFLVLCGLCTSLMWGAIFNLSVEGIGKYTEQASGFFMTMVVGGGVMPLLQNALAKSAGYMNSYWLVVAMLFYIVFYALWGSRNVNNNIDV